LEELYKKNQFRRKGKREEDRIQSCVDLVGINGRRLVSQSLNNKGKKVSAFYGEHHN